MSQLPQHRRSRQAFLRLEDLASERLLLLCVGVVMAMQCRKRFVT